MNYFEPDSIWERFDIKSEEDLLNRYFVKGKFHQSVPKVIQDDYKVVERLIAYSYYYYPLIDEALSKSTRIFEASVTLRLDNAGLKKSGFENLHSKIHRLEEHCAKDLFEQWLKAKEIRNMFAHREAGTLGGVLLMNAFTHNLNMINSIFISQNILEEKERQFLDLSEHSKHLEHGKFILSYHGINYLVQGAKPYTVAINNFNRSLWVFIPITGDNTIKEVEDLPKSFILRLEDVEVTESGLSAIDCDSRRPITLIKTNKFENLEKFKDHNIRMKILEAENSDIITVYMNLLKHYIGKEISKFLYDSWE